MITFGGQESGKHAPFLISLSEELDNALKLVISLSYTGEKGSVDNRESPALSHILKECRPIYPDKNQTYEILFEQYILYLNRNESYTSWDNSEIYKGKYFVIFEKSQLLTMLPGLTDCQILSDGTHYPGNWRHYGVYCQNHIIDVISCHEPLIKKL